MRYDVSKIMKWDIIGSVTGHLDVSTLHKGVMSDELRKSNYVYMARLRTWPGWIRIIRSGAPFPYTMTKTTFKPIFKPI